MGLRIEQVSGDQQAAVELAKTPGMLRWPPEQPPQSEAVNCPRCGSTNTKFCYYNNYNKSQPRHYCKVCKRHWTKGGMLRNVPVGGGRKKKRNRTSTSTGNKNKMNTPPPAGLDEFSANYNTKAEFGFTSFSSPFMENASLMNMNPISYQNSHDPWDLDSMESSSIITLDIPTTSNIPLDLPSYCNWDEIDPLTTSLDLSIEFDNVHAEIKP